MAVETIDFGGQSGKQGAVNPFRVRVMKARDVDFTVPYLRPRKLDVLVQAGTSFERVASTAGGRVVGSPKRWKARVGGDVIFIDDDGWRLETDTTGYDLAQPPTPSIVAVQKFEGIAFVPQLWLISYGYNTRVYGLALDTSQSPNPSDLANWSFDSGGTGWNTVGTWTFSGGRARCTAGVSGVASIASVASTQTLRRLTNVALVGVSVNSNTIETFDNEPPYVTLRVDHPSLLGGAGYEKTFDGDAFFPMGQEVAYGYSITYTGSEGSGNLVVTVTTNVKDFSFDGVIWWSDARYGVSVTYLDREWTRMDLDMRVSGTAPPDRTPFTLLPTCFTGQDWSSAAGVVIRSMDVGERASLMSAYGELDMQRELLGTDTIAGSAVNRLNYRFGTSGVPSVSGLRLFPLRDDLCQFYLPANVEGFTLSYDFGDEPVVVYVATEVKTYGDWEVESVVSQDVAVETDYRGHHVSVRPGTGGSGTRVVRLYRADSAGWHLVREAEVSAGSAGIVLTDTGGAIARPVALPTLPLPSGPCAWWNGRLVVASDRLYFSSVPNPFCFGDAPADDSSAFAMRVPGQVLALSTAQSALLVWTTNGVWSVVGNSPATAQLVHAGSVVPLSDRAVFGDMAVTATGLKSLAGEDIFPGDFTSLPSPLWSGSSWLAIGDADTLIIRTNRWGWVEWTAPAAVRDVDNLGESILVATAVGLYRLGEDAQRLNSCVFETGRYALVPPHRRKFLLCWRAADGATCEVDVMTELGEKTVTVPNGGGRVEIALPGSQLPRWIAYRLRAGGEVYLLADVAHDVEGGVPRAQ